MSTSIMVSNASVVRFDVYLLVLVSLRKRGKRVSKKNAC